MAKPSPLPQHTVYKVVAAWQYASGLQSREWLLTIDPAVDLPAGWPSPPRNRPELWKVIVRYVPKHGKMDTADPSTDLGSFGFVRRDGRHTPRMTIRDTNDLDAIVEIAHHELLHYLQWVGEQGRHGPQVDRAHYRKKHAAEQRERARKEGRMGRRAKVREVPKRYARRRQKEVRSISAGYLAQGLEPESDLSERYAGSATTSLPHSRRAEEFWPNLYSDVDRISRRLLQDSARGENLKNRARLEVSRLAATRFERKEENDEGEWVDAAPLSPKNQARYTKKKARYIGALLAAIEERLLFYGIPEYQREWWDTPVGEKLQWAGWKARRNTRSPRPPDPYRASFGSYQRGVGRLTQVTADALSGIVSLREEFLTAAAAASFYKDLGAKRRLDLVQVEKDLDQCRQEAGRLNDRIDNERRGRVAATRKAQDAERRASSVERAKAEALIERVNIEHERNQLRNQVKGLRENLESERRAMMELRPSPSASARKRARREKEAVMREQSKKDARKGKRRR